MKSRKEFLKWLCQPPVGSVPDGYYHGQLVYKAQNTKNSKPDCHDSDIEDEKNKEH